MKRRLMPVVHQHAWQSFTNRAGAKASSSGDDLVSARLAVWCPDGDPRPSVEELAAASYGLGVCPFDQVEVFFFESAAGGWRVLGECVLAKMAVTRNERVILEEIRALVGNTDPPLSNDVQREALRIFAATLTESRASNPPTRNVPRK